MSTKRKENHNRFCQLDYIPPAESINDYDDFAPIYNQIFGDDCSKIIFEGIKVSVESSFQTIKKFKYLDIGCGGGSMICLFSNEFDVECYGIELSKRQLDFAKEKLENEKVEATLLHGDAVKIDYPRQCDVVTMTLDVINHIKHPEDWLKIFKKVYDCLNPGGVFIFDRNTPKRLLEDFSYPEIILKRNLSYIQIGLEPEIKNEYVRRKMLMQVFTYSNSDVNKYFLFGEHTSISKKRVFQFLNSVGFSKIKEIFVDSNLRSKHIIMKNRVFLANYKE